MSVWPNATTSCVLHATITQLIYPVTEEILHRLFDAYGVNELCLLQRSTYVEVFVEFQSGLEASQARGALHGRCIYDGCCLLDIQHASSAISVFTLENSRPIVIDWDQVEMAPPASALVTLNLALPTPPSRHTSNAKETTLVVPDDAESKHHSVALVPAAIQLLDRTLVMLDDKEQD
ncbi:hypothetical protein QYE76_030136 [Lolium multiflorum]|uniref:PTBP1-like RNA recognition motif 2 domain-containing protein n=1 Tax=Lolium multiflorum TaxID=4521 RepID=A0AAD8QSS6_LOLMU|nr:hypothetical protein QYE76_030136 [Lolium multiflorum]